MKLSEAQARSLGLIPKKPPKTTRRTAKGPYHTRCHDCPEEFTTMASEDRHVEATSHARYDLVLDP